jgi:hypothetical protein
VDIPPKIGALVVNLGDNTNNKTQLKILTLKNKQRNHIIQNPSPIEIFYLTKSENETLAWRDHKIGEREREREREYLGGIYETIKA